MDNLDCAGFDMLDPIHRILKRQSDKKKAEEKSGVETNIIEVEKFNEAFREKQKEIEKKFDLSETIEHEKLFHHFKSLNGQIQELQKFYSDATIFLRVYDKKVCQSALHTLQTKLQDLENRLLPKKKFNFTTRRSKTGLVEDKNTVKTKSVGKKNEIQKEEICGFTKKENEILILKAEDIEKKDIILSDIKNSCVKLYGNPSALQINNLINCQIYCGPVTGSVFVENVNKSSLHLACQQLRIHDSTDTDFYVHVTSKAIIENSKDVRFGIYKFRYDGIENHYETSGLNRNINNWDKVCDFNWLAVDKPSPNWSTLVDAN